ncbi:hypothetical protein ACIGW4_33750 [Streptomyces sp. NPDC053513]|uniref:hypothetical protein n=1 Tax=unclassified Streptomyces TaxID=2593676 RepID=UPI0037D0CC99
MSSTNLPSAGDWIRGISVKQPHAACILAGKNVENRPAYWPWRGWLLLRAGQATERAPLRDPLVSTAIRGRDLHTGAVIGITHLTDCHQDPAGTPPCSRWTQTDAWHLVLADVHELPLPSPAVRGQLGAWKPTQDLVDQVRLQLPQLTPESTS